MVCSQILFSFPFFLITFLFIISSMQLKIEAVFGLLMFTLSFDHGNCTDVSVNVFAGSNGAPAFVVTAKIYYADFPSCNDLCKKLHSHAIPRTSAADYVLLGFVKGEHEFSNSTIPIRFIVPRKVKAYQHLATHCLLDSTFGNLGDKSAKIRLLFWKRSASACGCWRRCQWNGKSAQFWNIWHYKYNCAGAKLHVAPYYLESQFFRVCRTNDPAIPLRDISNSHVLPIAQFFRTYGVDHAKSALYVTLAVTANRFEERKAAPSVTLFVLQVRLWLSRLRDIGFRCCSIFR